MVVKADFDVIIAAEISKNIAAGMLRASKYAGEVCLSLATNIILIIKVNSISPNKKAFFPEATG